MRRNGWTAVLGMSALLAGAASSSSSDKPRLKASPLGADGPDPVLRDCPLPEILVPDELPFTTPPAPEACDDDAHRSLRLRRGADVASFNAGLLQARLGICRQLFHLETERRGPVTAEFAAAQRRSIKALGSQMQVQWDRFAAACPRRAGDSR